MSARRRFINFMVVGALAAAVNIVTRAAASLVVPYSVAIVIAFGVALTLAFTLNRIYVFGRLGNRTHQFGRFFLVNVAALLQIWVVSLVLARYLLPWIGESWQPEFVAHTIGVLSPVVSSYVAHKHFTFAHS